MTKGSDRQSGPFPHQSTIVRIVVRRHRTRRGRASVVLAGVLLLLAGCSTSREAGTVASTGAAESYAVIDEVPVEARVATGVGEPRSSGYWVIWSSCGENNRAETAAANGGREAGWILLDDLLAFPGVTLGTHTVATCEEGVVILEASSDADPTQGLARQLLAAELNLSSGSETCEAAEEIVVVAHALLSSFEYAGTAHVPLPVDDKAIDSLDRLIDLLAAYNLGELCR
jgi:hypothetical protein